MRWAALRLGFLAAALWAALPGLPPAAAQTQTPRAAVQDGYARMVFDWDGPVVYSAEAVNGQLILRFNRAAEGDLRRLVAPLAAYVREVSVSEDRRTAIFPLLKPVTVRAFVVGSSLVVDLVEPAGPAVAGDTPPPSAPVATAAGPSGTERATAPPAVAKIGIRGGEHAGFHRIVFDWPQPVEYRVEKDGNDVALTFARDAVIDAAALRAALPPDTALVGIAPADGGTRIAVTLPAGARLRHFRSGPRVVADIVRAAASAAPSRPAGAQPVPLAPSPGDDEPVPALKPLVAEPAPRPPAAALAKAEPPANGNDALEAVALPFQWHEQTAAAVFRRAGWLWAVFDRPSQVDLRSLRKLAGETVRHIEQISHPKATVVRLLTVPGYEPSVRREGLLWILDLSGKPMAPPSPIPISYHEGAAGPSLFLEVAEGGTVLDIPDPEVGDIIKVAPVLPVGYGVFPARDYADLRLEATAQGVVAIPKADGIRLSSSRLGVGIEAEGGLHLGQDPRGGAAARLGRADGAPLFDLERWARGGPRKLYHEKYDVQALAVRAPAGKRNPARLEVARYYLANGHAADALAILRLMASDEPAVIEAPAYRAVRGMAMLLMGRFAEAAEDLGRDEFRAVPQAQFWRSAAIGAPNREFLQEEGPSLLVGLPYLAKYPRPVKVPLGMLAADALISAGDDKISGELLELVAEEKLTRLEKGMLLFLQGRLKALAGAFDEAVELWQEAERGGSRRARALAARERLEHLYTQEKIARADLIDGLEGLRFAWRDGDYEFGLIRRLGDLRIEGGDFPAGLRAYKQAVTDYPQYPGAKELALLMNETFERLFLESGADSLPPVTAIALFDEFRELTPSGERGDEMIRKLADRLVAVDLLDRAAELLRHQVEYRLAGTEKARVGARLTVVELLDRKPESALEALKISETPELPADLAGQRRHLKARALSDAGRPADALTLLAGDESIDAKLLRAEVQWRSRDWKAAAETFSTLVDMPAADKTLTPTSARFVLHWATALALAGEDGELRRMGDVFTAAMAESPYRDAFRLLVSDVGGGLIDYRTVADRIKQAEDFQTFMATYRKRLRADGLSTIN